MDQKMQYPFCALTYSIWIQLHPTTKVGKIFWFLLFSIIIPSHCCLTVRTLKLIGKISRIPKSARTANQYRRGRGERVWLWIGQWSHQSKDHGSGGDSLEWNILTIRLNAHIGIHSNWNPRNPLWDDPSSWSILAVFTSHQGTGMKGIGIAKFFFVMNADCFPLLRLRFRRVSIVIWWSLPLTIRLENRWSHFRIHHGYQTVQ